MAKKKEKTTTEPTTLAEAIRYFKDTQHCIDYFVAYRWPNGVTCPICGSKDVGWLPNQWRWYCKTRHALRQFSVKTGTVMADSPLGLDKWLPAIWMLTACKNGISSYELARGLDVCQKTAWFMLHRVRLGMQNRDGGQLEGEVEVDETFIGGKARFIHAWKRAEKIHGTGGSGKVAVAGLLARHGHGGKKHSTVRTQVVNSRKRVELDPLVRKNVKPGSEIMTDELKSYDALAPDYVHNVINHAEAYVKGNVHTNGMENFWSLLKRAIRGTYVSVEPYHLFRYLDEEGFRFNERQHEDGDRGRFIAVLKQMVGRRITYKQLTGHDEPELAAVPA